VKSAVYVRKSTEDERSGDDGKSIVRQEELARAFAQKQGWSVVEVFKDDGISGTEFVNRPGFNQLIAEAKQRSRPFDVVVMMALSRLGRDRERVSMALKELYEARVRVFKYQQGGQEIKLSTAEERMAASFEAFADEAFRRNISYNTREALHRKASKGHAVSSPPYAYTVGRQGEHSEYEKIEDDAQRAHRVFELAAEGFGNGQIAAKLNGPKTAQALLRNLDETRCAKEEGREPIFVPIPPPAIPGPDGRPWSKEQVRRVLANRIYKGELVYGKWRSVDREGSAGKRELVPEHEWIVAKAPHLRIVSDALWAKVRAIRAKTLIKYGVPKTFNKGTEAERKQVGPVPVNTGQGTEHMLNQICRCGFCQGTLSLMKTRDSGRYYCNTRKRTGTCPNGRGVPADLLEDFVREALHEKLSDDRYILELLNLLNRRTEKWNREHAMRDGARAALERNARRLESAVERLRIRSSRVSPSASGSSSGPPN
jgi:DNA invertase Pin-like site-specific DNA recombinase